MRTARARAAAVIRVEVDYFGVEGRRTTVLFVEPEITPLQRALADPIIDRLLNRLQGLGLNREDAKTWALCHLVELHADSEAYERESARRGVLAL